MHEQSGPRAAVDFSRLFAGLPTAYLVLDPDLVIVEANQAYQELLGRRREELVGRWAFEAFPPAPGSLDDQGRNPLQLAFEEARDTGRTVPLPLFEYAVRDLGTGEDRTRFWSLIISPLQGVDGRVTALLQRVEDVTDYVQEQQRARADVQLGRERVLAVEGDLYRRVQQLQVAQDERERAVAQLVRSSELATALADADTIDDVESVVFGAGSQVLGVADAALVSLAGEPGRPSWRVTTGGAGPERTVPHDSPVAVCESARTGDGWTLSTSSTPSSPHPVTGEVVEQAEGGAETAWVLLPLTAAGRRLGCLALSWGPGHRPGAEQETLSEGFAAQCAQTLARLAARETERRTSAEHRRMSETLQRALLTSPPVSDDTQIVVRYQPAAIAAQVGGDWYDAFRQPDGATVLVIGDVLGHDTNAAAAMGQIRTVLRTIGALEDRTPAVVLTRTDRAMANLQLDTTATVIVARLEQTVEERGRGETRLRWSNAGHPPAVVLTPDGTVTPLVTADADLLLGVVPDGPRQESVEVLPRGTTVLLYTDGLVERRDQDLQHGLELLQRTLRELSGQGLDLDVLVDRLLSAMLPAQPEDDVAVVAIRLHQQDARPEGTGPLG